MNKSETFRTVFIGELVQETSLSVGGSVEENDKDAPLAKDGLNRFVIRGTSLAGALISTIRKLGYKVPGCIAFSDKGEEQSRWIIHNSHLVEDKDIEPEMRQMVSIVSKTKGASPSALFEAEVIPKGNKWQFFVEVDTIDYGNGKTDDGKKAEYLLALVVKEWEKHGYALGANNARGMGFVKLDNVKAYRISPAGIKHWPSSKEEDYRNYFNNKKGINELEINELIKSRTGLLEVDKKTGTWKYAEIPVKIKVGLNDDGYGIDTLSIGGHASIMEEAKVTDDEYLKPDGINFENWTKETAPDSFFVSTRNKEGKLVPFIPGSSIRGALRHALSSLLRKEGEPIIDVVYDEEERNEYEHLINRLFGYVDKKGKEAEDGALIIQDAYLVNDDDYKMMIVENHAEDEFTQGVYGSGKFNKAIMVEGEFEFKMRVEVCKKDKDTVSPDDKLKEYIELLRKALRLANIGHLDLGGSVYKGSGWVKWCFDEASIRDYGRDVSSNLVVLGGNSDGNKHK